MYVVLKIESRKYYSLDLEERVINLYANNDRYDGMMVCCAGPGTAISSVFFLEVEVKEKDIDRFMELRQQLETDLHAKVTVYYPGL